MTYSALCALLILEDDFSCIKKLQLLDWVGRLQLENGRYESLNAPEGLHCLELV